MLYINMYLVTIIKYLYNTTNLNIVAFHIYYLSHNSVILIRCDNYNITITISNVNINYKKALILIIKTNQTSFSHNFV